MSSDTTRALVLPVTILASVAAGVGIGTFLVRPASPVSELRPASSDVSDLVIAVRGLTDEMIRARRDTNGLSAIERIPARSEVDSSQADATGSDIRTATRELTAAIELLRTSVTSARSERAPLIAPSSPPDAALLEEFRADGFSAQNKTYQLLTCQQIMDRFGMPAAVGADANGTWWKYRPRSGAVIWFTFVDGRVVYVRCDDPPG